MPFPITVGAATIADGESLSNAVYVGYGLLVGFIVPAGWDTADITLQAAPEEGATFYNVYEPDSNTEYTIEAGASRHITLPNALRGLGWVKVRSGTGASPAAQSGTVVVGVVTHKETPSYAR